MTALAESAALCCVMCPEPIDYIDQDSLLGFCHHCARLEKGKSGEKAREEKKEEIKKKQKKTPEQGIQKPKKQREEKTRVVDVRSEEDLLIAEAARLEAEAEKARLEAEAKRQQLALLMERRRREQEEERERQAEAMRRQLGSQRMLALIDEIIALITTLARAKDEPEAAGLVALDRLIKTWRETTNELNTRSLHGVMTLAQSRQAMMHAYLLVLDRFAPLCTRTIKPYTDTRPFDPERYSVIVDAEPPAGETYDLELIVQMPGQVEQQFGQIGLMAHNFAEALAYTPLTAGSADDYLALDSKLEVTRSYAETIEMQLIELFQNMDRLNVERSRRYPKLIPLVESDEDDVFFERIGAAITALFRPYAFIFAETLALYHGGLIAFGTFPQRERTRPAPRRRGPEQESTTTTTTTTTIPIVGEEEEEEEDSGVLEGEGGYEETGLVSSHEESVDIDLETSGEESEELVALRQKHAKERPAWRHRMPTKKGATIVDEVLIPDVEVPILAAFRKQLEWFRDRGYGNMTDYMILLIGVMHNFKEAAIYTEEIANEYYLSLACFLFVHIRLINYGRDQDTDYLYDFTGDVYGHLFAEAATLTPSKLTEDHVNDLASHIFHLIRGQGQQRIHRLSAEEEADVLRVWDVSDPQSQMFIDAARRILAKYIVMKGQLHGNQEPTLKDLTELMDVDTSDVISLSAFLDDEDQGEANEEKKAIKKEEKAVREDQDRIRRETTQERIVKELIELLAQRGNEPTFAEVAELDKVVRGMKYRDLLKNGLPKYGLTSERAKAIRDGVTNEFAGYKQQQKSRKKRFTHKIEDAVKKAGVYLLITKELVALMIAYGLLEEDYDLYTQYPGLTYAEEVQSAEPKRKQPVFIIHADESSGEEDLGIVSGEEEPEEREEDTEYGGRGAPVIRYRRAREKKKKKQQPVIPEKKTTKKKPVVEEEEEEEEVEEMEPEITTKPKKRPTPEQTERYNASRREKRRQKKGAQSASSDVTPSMDGEESTTSTTTTTQQPQKRKRAPPKPKTPEQKARKALNDKLSKARRKAKAEAEPGTTQQPQKLKRAPPKPKTPEQIAEQKARKALNDKLSKARRKAEAEAEARGAPRAIEKEPMKPLPAIVMEEEEEEPSGTESEEEEEEPSGTESEEEEPSVTESEEEEVEGMNY